MMKAQKNISNNIQLHLIKSKKIFIKNHHHIKFNSQQRYKNVICQNAKPKRESSQICYRALRKDQYEKILKVANKIFPVGTDWEEYWNTDDFEEW